MLLSIGRFALALPILLSVTTEARGQSASPRTLTIEGSRVATWNVAGTTSIVAGTGRTTEVTITLRGRDADRLRIEERTRDGRPGVAVVYPDDVIIYPPMGRSANSTFTIDRDGTWGGSGWRGDRIRVRGSGSGLEAWADVVVRVPRSVQIAAHQAVGTLSARDITVDDLLADVMSADTELERVTGTIRVDAGSGETTGRELVGDVSVDVGSGATELRNVKGDRVFVDAGSGSVTMAGISARELTVDIGSGRTELSEIDVRTLHVDSGSGAVRAALTQLVSDVLIDTGSGGVELLLPSAFDARVDIDAGSGGIDTEFPVRVTRVERDELHGVIGQGRGSLRVDTGSGRVRLRKAM
jgi:lia operon protein LiaG